MAKKIVYVDMDNTIVDFKSGIKRLSKIDIKEYKDIEGKMKELDNLLDKVYWYDKKVFDLISEGMSIAELSKKSGISYYSLYNTYKNVKSLIKNNIQWD